MNTGTDGRGSFLAEFLRWREEHAETHHAFVAALSGGELAGMAWVALLPRVVRPGQLSRLSADVQSVCGRPARRGSGLGSRLVEAVADHAAVFGATRVTVYASGAAVAVYERWGLGPSRRMMQRPPEA